MMIQDQNYLGGGGVSDDDYHDTDGKAQGVEGALTIIMT